MYIKRVLIKNFKCFKDFKLDLDQGLNILVGNNAEGKSTILEAIHLAITGIFQGKYLKNDLTHDLFNKEIVSAYIDEIKKSEGHPLPEILIEIYLSEGDSKIKGAGNSSRIEEYGLSYKIAFDDEFKDHYAKLIERGNIKTLPIEYYDVTWKSFARTPINFKNIPIKAALIDSSSSRFQNGSEIYISRIIKENLETNERVGISQAYREMIGLFSENSDVKDINNKITQESETDKTINISVDFPAKNAWENILMTYVDSIPFHQIGKGEQCIIKTKLALSHKKAKEANVILMEEPENHLSHSKLNTLINIIKNNTTDRQIILSTHSSFIANKLGLSHLIIINKKNTLRLHELTEETQEYFEKLSGYNTLRLILCNKAILVEGDSDELIVQKAYQTKNSNKLPIEDGIDVISVGTSFLRFLEIAKEIGKSISVATDNDGNLPALKNKYKGYLKNEFPNIRICFDDTSDARNDLDGEKFNFNTLEPNMLKVNNLQILNQVFNTNFNENDLLKYMRDNKTNCALKIFKTPSQITFPKYIMDAIQ